MVRDEREALPIQEMLELAAKFGDLADGVPYDNPASRPEYQHYKQLAHGYAIGAAICDRLERVQTSLVMLISDLAGLSGALQQPEKPPRKPRARRKAGKKAGRKGK